MAKALCIDRKKKHMSHIVLLKRLIILLAVCFASSPIFAQGDRLKPGVVRVTSQSGQQRGSGFIVKLDTVQHEVYVVTAAHVVGDDKHPQVEFYTRQHRPVSATTILFNEALDTAILLISGSENIPGGLMALNLDSQSLSALEEVFVIGSPRLGAPWSLMKAYVSAVEGESVFFFGDIGEGVSGGCLVRNDVVIGMVIAGPNRALQQPGSAVRAGLISELLKGLPALEIRKAAVAGTDVSPNRSDSASNPITPAAIAWNNFRGMGKKLLKYDYISRFNEELAQVCLNKKCGFINKSGDVAIPLKYDVAGTGYFSEGLATVKLNGRYGFIDKTGKISIPALYDQVSPFHDGLATATLNDKKGYIDRTGKVVIPIKYEGAVSFSEGLLGVMLDGKYGFINKKGRVIIPFEYDQIYWFSNGLAAVNKWEGYSELHCLYIDTSGKVIIDLFYSHNHCSNFSEGLAAVGRMVGYDKNKDEPIFKWGFIDRNGQAITKLVYDEYGSFSQGLAVVVKDKKLGFIDKDGSEVVPLKYDEGFVSDSLIHVVLNNKYGFLDHKGNEITSLKYDSVWCYAYQKEGFIGVTLNGKKGFVDLYGNEYFNF